MTNLAKPGRNYYAPRGGLPPQTDLITDRAVFTEAYAVIPQCRKPAGKSPRTG